MPAGGLERFSGIPSFFRKEGPSPEQEIYGSTLNAYRAWNVREKGSIIDFDLTAGPDDFEEVSRGFSQDATLEDRSHMVGVLGRLLSRVQVALPMSKENNYHFLKFLEARLEASLWFAMRLRGEELDGLVYIEKTNGVRPEQTGVNTLLPLRERIFKLAKQEEIPIYEPKAFSSWRKTHRLDPQSTKEKVREAVEKSLVAVSEFTGDDSHLGYEINGVNENKYYYAWARTNYETLVFALDLNFHKTKIWTPGKAEELGSHEGGQHLRRMNDWREQIRKGKMPSVIGQTVVHAPESVVEEGLAVTLPHFVPKIYDQMSPEGKLQVDMSILKCLVYGNVSIMLNGKERPSLKKIVEYVHEYMPWETKNEIERQIKWRTEDETFQAYLPSYGFGVRIFLEIIETLSERGRKQLLRDLSQKPYTPEQLTKRVAELKNGKKNRTEKSNNTLTAPSVASF